tara:strand:- start:1231 stop:1392 length:162 start_codon:yes stop_codon:yes gene_type:complete
MLPVLMSPPSSSFRPHFFSINFFFVGEKKIETTTFSSFVEFSFFFYLRGRGEK